MQGKRSSFELARSERQGWERLESGSRAGNLIPAAPCSSLASPKPGVSVEQGWPVQLQQEQLSPSVTTLGCSLRSQEWLPNFGKSPLVLSGCRGYFRLY